MPAPWPRPCRACSPPRLSRSLPAPAGQLALHGAEGLAEDRVLLLPMQVPGGSCRVREGAPGQVSARPGPIRGYLATAGCRGVGVPPCLSELGMWACCMVTWRHNLSPLIPPCYRISCSLGKIFAPKLKSSEAPETQVDACGKRQEFGCSCQAGKNGKKSA